MHNIVAIVCFSSLFYFHWGSGRLHVDFLSFPVYYRLCCLDKGITIGWRLKYKTKPFLINTNMVLQIINTVLCHKSDQICIFLHPWHKITKTSCIISSQPVQMRMCLLFQYKSLAWLHVKLQRSMATGLDNRHDSPAAAAAAAIRELLTLAASS